MNINKKEFCLIGCGRLGINLTVFLSQQGFIPKAFSSKNLESAKKALEITGQGRVYENPVDAAKSCSLVFITTPDTIIEPVCENIAQQSGFNKNSVVFHLSGALSSAILKSAKQNGADVGSIHPLQAFAPYEQGQESPFKGINISIEGDEKAVELGKEIVNALHANSFTIPTGAKTLYHASAVVASNYLVTLEHFVWQGEMMKLSQDTLKILMKKCRNFQSFTACLGNTPLILQIKEASSQRQTEINLVICFNP